MSARARISARRQAPPACRTGQGSDLSEAGRINMLFERHHFDCEVVALCVHWYLHSKPRLSLREVVEMMAERGLSVAHTTLMRWARRCDHTSGPGAGPLDGPADFAVQSWRVEETQVKTRGRWCHLHRAVDSTGRTVDFWLGDRRDVAAAEAFFGRAIDGGCPPPQTALGSSHRHIGPQRVETRAKQD